MRKLLLLALVTLLASTVLSVSAYDDPNMTAIASYIGDDALMFASIRTDDSFIASLDSLISRAEPFLPQGTLPPNIITTDLLNLALDSANLGTFDEDVRPWLGDVAAIAVYPPESPNADPAVLAVVKIDGKSALAFFKNFFADDIQAGNTELTQENTYSIFTSTDEYNPMWLAIGADVMFLASTSDALPLEGVSNPLSDNERFVESVHNLPEDNYSILMYANMQELQRFNLAQAGMAMNGMPTFVEELMNAYGGIAMGLTVLDEGTLVLDIAESINPDAYSQFGMDFSSVGTLDTAFTNHIPADAFFVLQSADFGINLKTGLDSMRTIGQYIKDNGGLADMIDPDGFQFSEEERQIINQFDLAWFVGAINLSFAGGTGLNLERDVLPVLDGDMAIYVSASPSDSFISPVLPDAAIFLQNSDADAAVAMVEQLMTSAQAYDLQVLQEDYGNGTAIVAPAEDYLGFPNPSLDVLLGASDDVFAIGTRNAVNALVNMDTSIGDDAIFQNASQYFVPNTQSLFYLATPPIFDAVDTLITSGDVPASSSDLQAYQALSLLESMSITGAFNSDTNAATVRLAISLSEEPRPLPQVPDA